MKIALPPWVWPWQHRMPRLLLNNGAGTNSGRDPAEGASSDWVRSLSEK